MIGTIRPFETKDEEELLDVWHRASQIAHDFLDIDFFVGERREIREQWLPIAETVVFETDGRLVGFLSLIGNEVGAIFVDPDYQGQGVGRSLMDWARDSSPILELNVFEANTLGRRFYESYGFQDVGRSIHEATGEPELRLRLG